MLRHLHIFTVGLVLVAARLAVAQQPPRLVLVDDEALLEQALAAPTPPHDLAVRVAAFTMPGDKSMSTRLLLVADIDDRDNPFASTSVVYSLLNEKGQRQAHAIRRVELPHTESGTFSFREVLSVPPGTYRLKVAVMRNGRLGVAQDRVAARAQGTEAVGVGDLLLGETPGAEAALTATADRRVRGEQLVVTWPFALHNADPAGLTLTLEAAKSAEGDAVVAQPLKRLSNEGATQLAQAIVDARVLPVGAYTARATMLVAGKEVARVTAPFTIERAVAAAATTGGAGVRSRDAASLDAASTAAFRLEEVLDPRVLAPFLDELALRAPERSRPAIERAKTGAFGEAAELVKGTDPQDPTKPFLQGLSLLSKRQLQAASEAFRETLRASPDYFVGAFYIGTCYAAGGRDQQAISAWQTSLVSLDTYPVVFRLLAEAESRLGLFQRALDLLEEATAKWPQDGRLRLSLARAALAARHYDRAWAAVDAAPNAAGVDAELLFTGARAVFEQATGGGGPLPADALARIKRYRDAYVAAGGERASLLNEWVAALEKMAS